MAYKAKLDRFDMERGDVLTIPRKDCVELREYTEDDAGKILVALVKYVAGNPGDPMPEIEGESDPRIKRYLSGTLHRLIEQQRERAARYGDYLAQQRKNAQGGQPKPATANHGQPRLTTASLIEGKEEVEEESPKGKDFPSSTTSNLPPNKLGHAGDAPAPAAGGTCVNAAPCGTRTVTRVAYTDYWDSEKPKKVFAETELRARPVSFMLEAIEETGDQLTRNALMKAVEELGPDRFAETCWRFVADMVQKENAFAAAFTRADEIAKKNGNKGEEWIKKMDEIAQSDTLPYNQQNKWLIEPWRKWRVLDFNRGRFLMAALKEARLAAGIPTTRKPSKGEGGEA